MSAPSDDVNATDVYEILLHRAVRDQAIKLGILKAAIGILVADAVAAGGNDPDAAVELKVAVFAQQVRAAYEAIRPNVTRDRLVLL